MAQTEKANSKTQITTFLFFSTRQSANFFNPTTRRVSTTTPKVFLNAIPSSFFFPLSSFLLFPSFLFPPLSSSFLLPPSSFLFLPSSFFLPLSSFLLLPSSFLLLLSSFLNSPIHELANPPIPLTKYISTQPLFFAWISPRYSQSNLSLTSS